MHPWSRRDDGENQVQAAWLTLSGRKAEARFSFGPQAEWNRGKSSSLMGETGLFCCGRGAVVVWQAIRRDIRAIFERDPAARSLAEVLLCYPGLHALVTHRVAHVLWRRRLRLPARFLSHAARFLTGVEIHPAAVIGSGVFIDHGHGVVIGETAEVGDDVTIYQGATLGGTGKEKGKRHPTIGRGVVISAGAKVLGSFKVGDYARIGAGAVVLKEVPSGATVVGVPARVVRMPPGQGRLVVPEIDLNHGNLPDPQDNLLRCVSQSLEGLERQIEVLQARVAELEEELEGRRKAL